MIFFTVIGYMLLFLLIIIFSVIIIPYSYCFKFTWDNQAVARGRVAWLFGGLKINILLADWKIKTAEISVFGIDKNIDPESFKSEKGKKKSGKKDKKERNKTKGKKEKKQKKNKIKSEYFDKEIIYRLIFSIKKIWRHIRPGRIYIRLEGGLKDPMHTGLLCAVLSQTWILDERYDINFQPSFDDETLKGKLFISGKISVIYIFITGIRFILSKPVRRTVFK